jgi:hypothetical protein
MKRNEVAVDFRGKISLDFRRSKEHIRYLAEESPDGVITLTPAARVPAYLLRPDDGRDKVSRGEA